MRPRIPERTPMAARMRADATAPSRENRDPRPIDDAVRMSEPESSVPSGAGWEPAVGARLILRGHGCQHRRRMSPRER